VIVLVVQLLVVIAACVEIINASGAQPFTGVVLGYCLGDVTWRLWKLVFPVKDAGR
jgi:hypothetical protein